MFLHGNNIKQSSVVSALPCTEFITYMGLPNCEPRQLKSQDSCRDASLPREGRSLDP